MLSRRNFSAVFLSLENPTLTGEPVRRVDMRDTSRQRKKVCHCEPVPQHWCGNPHPYKVRITLTVNGEAVYTGKTDCRVAAFLAMTWIKILRIHLLYAIRHSRTVEDARPYKIAHGGISDIKSL